MQVRRALAHYALLEKHDGFVVEAAPACQPGHKVLEPRYAESVRRWGSAVRVRSVMASSAWRRGVATPSIEGRFRPKRGIESGHRVDEGRVMPVNIIGLGLIIAGVLFMYFLNFVGFVIGLPMVLGGIVALFLTYRRKKQLAT
jgi:hypothetical protein